VSGVTAWIDPTTIVNEPLGPTSPRPLPSMIPTAAEARAYLESLPDLWAKTSDAVL
jgi:hypothetical protein